MGGGSSACTYARIDSVEMPRPRELGDWWEDPSSYFLIPGVPQVCNLKCFPVDARLVPCGAGPPAQPDSRLAPAWVALAAPSCLLTPSSRAAEHGNTGPGMGMRVVV